MEENINWSSITSIKIGFEIYQGRSFKIVSRLLRWFNTELNGEYSFTNDLRYLIFDLKKFKLVVVRLCGHSGYNLYLEDFVELWLYNKGNKNNYLIKSPPIIIDKIGYGNIDYRKVFLPKDADLYMNFNTSEFGDFSSNRMYSNNITTGFKYCYDAFCKEHPNWIWYLYLSGFPNIKPPQKT